MFVAGQHCILSSLLQSSFMHSELCLWSLFSELNKCSSLNINTDKYHKRTIIDRAVMCGAMLQAAGFWHLLFSEWEQTTGKSSGWWRSQPERFPYLDTLLTPCNRKAEQLVWTIIVWPVMAWLPAYLVQPGICHKLKSLPVSLQLWGVYFVVLEKENL